MFLGVETYRIIDKEYPARTSSIGSALGSASAYHILNNVTLYIINGFGIQTVSTNLNISDLVFDFLLQGVFIVLIFFLGGKIKEQN